ncbi:hypothetical protein B0A49_12935, partial [Cryomyces minteri]
MTSPTATSIDAPVPLAKSRLSTASESSIDFSSAKSTASTPRDSDIELPISPPLSSSTTTAASKSVPKSVSRILQHFRRRKDGVWVEEDCLVWNKQRLLREDYTALLDQLDEDEDLKGYIEDKIRYDYDWEEQYITIRMPTTLHEEFVTGVVKRIEAGLAALSASHPQLRELDKVSRRGNPDIFFDHNSDSEADPNKRSHNSPDAAFRHKQASWPSVILEVSYSQKRKDLSKLAYRYIRNSEASIKSVVGLDIEYTSPRRRTKTKEATVSIWRPGLVEEEGKTFQDAVQVVQNDVFRSAGGEPLGGSLVLNIADFLPSQLLRDLTTADQDRTIRLSFADLTADLNEAEEAHRICHDRTGYQESPPTVLWRKRKATPDEELSDGRETKYQALEEAEQRNASQDDSDFSSPPRPARSTRPMPERRRSTHEKGRICVTAVPSVTTNPISLSHFNAEMWKAAYLDWMVRDNISFSQATSPKIRRLFELSGLQGTNLYPVSHNTPRDWIMKLHQVQQVQIKELLTAARSRIHLSFDLWSSSSGLSLVGVVAHFIDQDAHLKVVLLGLRRIEGDHTGENIAVCITSVIHEYSIGSRLGCFVLDNASNNNTCIQTLAKVFHINPSEQRLRCAGHIINLVVKAILFGEGIDGFQKQLAGAGDVEVFNAWRIYGAIGKLHNVAKYINRSDTRQQEFRRAQQSRSTDQDVFYYKLIKDGGVRWSSTYDMISRGLKLRDAIGFYLYRWKKPADKDSYDLSQDRLTQDDWEELQRFADLLKPLKDLTMRVQGNANKPGFEGSHGAVWEVLTSMDFIFTKLEQAAKLVSLEPESYFKTGVDLGFSKLREYYRKTDLSSVYRASVALHPAYKFDYFEEKWNQHRNWITTAKAAVTGLFQQYVDRAAHQVSDYEDESSVSESEFSAFCRTSSSFRSKKRRLCGTELDRFMNESLENVKDPLDWWRRRTDTYPVLSKMAFDLFSVPGMSSECERVFSAAKKLITDERNCLQPDIIQANECFKCGSGYSLDSVFIGRLSSIILNTPGTTITSPSQLVAVALQALA